MKQLDSIARLINKFTKLPGVGVKTAQRYAYGVIDMSEADAAEFCAAIDDVKRTVRYCSECGNFSESELCAVCKTRDKRIITVVAYPKDVQALERASALKTSYHVLHGTLSPLDGRGPEDIRIKQLLARLDGVEEVILATNPDVEGEATAMYIAKLIKPLGIKTTRLAQGISMGSDIEYADEVTLARALTSRIEI
ncbi:MAG: recombination mediator RecR [Clostridiales bacterium]|jgi:recombination protein RecR|nr:recombination mediator RecR [Clostridiales bacterium]